MFHHNSKPQNADYIMNTPESHLTAEAPVYSSQILLDEVDVDFHGLEEIISAVLENPLVINACIMIHKDITL